MKKSDKIIYYISTGLISLLMIMSAGMYFFNNPEVSKTFTSLGFPTYIIYPLAIAKILGVIAIWTNLSKVLKYLAYSGFFFNLLLALSAHLNINDGDFPGAAIGLVLLITSFIFDRRIEQAKA